jgi:uncharacterized membrane protein
MPATSATGLRPISIARRPLYALLLPVPIVCFIGNLLTDLTYIGSGGNLLWLDFSTWLNAAGLLFGGIAAVILFIDTLRSSMGWATFLFLAAAWIVEFINALVHARDGWTAVAGAGLILSIVGVLLVLVSGWLWQSLRYGDERARP